MTPQQNVKRVKEKGWCVHSVLKNGMYETIFPTRKKLMDKVRESLYDSSPEIMKNNLQEFKETCRVVRCVVTYKV